MIGEEAGNLRGLGEERGVTWEKQERRMSRVKPLNDDEWRCFAIAIPIEKIVSTPPEIGVKHSKYCISRERHV